jgi:hypothetical protein
MVWDALVPTSIDPQFIEVIAVVQALSEYTPMFGPVVICEDDAPWLTVKTAAVKPDSAIATVVRTTTKYLPAIAILFASLFKLYIKT